MFCKVDASNDQVRLKYYKDFKNTYLGTLSEKKVLSRTLKGSSAQRSAGTFKGSR